MRSSHLARSRGLTVRLTLPVALLDGVEAVRLPVGVEARLPGARLDLRPHAAVDAVGEGGAKVLGAGVLELAIAGLEGWCAADGPVLTLLHREAERGRGLDARRDVVSGLDQLALTLLAHRHRPI